MREWRPISFYKEIQRLPNVRLLHHSLKNDEIYQKCSLVITVNGTAALEAAFYQKPSIVFTDIGYKILPSVHKLSSLEDLPSTIRSSLQKNVDALHIDKYVNLIEKNLINFDLVSYFTDYQNHFYYGGHLLDVTIPLEKMEVFIHEQKSKFDYLAQEYMMKFKNLN